MNANFRPLPFLGNPHVQTILGSLLRSPVLDVPFRERRLLLPDGDRLLLYDSMPRRWQLGQAMVLLVHGLCGTHLSGYMVRLTRLLVPKGYRVVRMTLRGAGRGLRWARRLYNATDSQDVRRVVEELRRWSPQSPIIAVGFSLGGNLVLKMAGEAVERPLPGLEAVCAVNPPIDTEACSALLARPENRIYDRYFANTLVASARRHRRFFPDLPPVRFPQNLTLRQFDDLYTAPRGGFADALDYYRKAAALSLLPNVTTKTLILTARDDPFIAVEPFLSLPKRPNLEIHIVPCGGHLGFLGLDGKGNIRWMDQQLVEWICRTVPASTL